MNKSWIRETTKQCAKGIVVEPNIINIINHLTNKAIYIKKLAFFINFFKSQMRYIKKGHLFRIKKGKQMITFMNHCFRVRTRVS